MIRRSLTLALLFTLLLASAPSTTRSEASARVGQSSSDAQHKGEADRKIQEQGRSINYDETGRVAKLTLPAIDGKTVALSLTYDEKGRIQYIVQEDGTKMRLTYDASGQWRSVIFDDGGRATLERDRSGNVVGLRTERPPSRKTSRLKGTNGARLRKASAAVPDACQDAKIKATAAVLAMGAACVSGLSVECVVATANAAYMTYLAIQACKGDGPATEESAA